MDSSDKLSKKIAGFFSGKISFLGKKSSDRNQAQFQLDKKLVFSLSKSRIPSLRQLSYIGKYLTKAEKTIILSALAVFIASSGYLSFLFYRNHLVVLPLREGEYIEGLIGAPKHINPLYSSINDVDSDIVRLVYSSLFKRDAEGRLVNDLVSEYSVSSTSKEYVFTLRDGAFWHDGAPVTADDVIFTVDSIQDSQLKSPLRSSFEGVVFEKIDDETNRKFKIVLPNAYAAFLDLLTFGIMPSDKWSQIAPESFPLAELNTKPIGSGPYKFNKLVKDTSGGIREYHLAINETYYGERPYLGIIFKFYPDGVTAIDALNNAQVNGLAYIARDMRDSLRTPKLYEFEKLSLPSLTALFFNEKNNPVLGSKEFRQALAFAINKKEIIEQDMSGDALAVEGPILPSSFAYDQDIKKYPFDIAKSAELLDAAGYKIAELTAESIAEKEKGEDKEAAQELKAIGPGKWRAKDGAYPVVTITTIDRTENHRVAESVKRMWEAVGIRTEVLVVPASQIQSQAIRPRNFEVLFYGQVIGADPDPYAFWHSTQIGEKGFNIANYNNKEVDKILEEARESLDQAARIAKYKTFQSAIAEDVPAVFIYSPAYVYPHFNDLKGFGVKNIIMPSDRFADIEKWYIHTGRRIDWN